MISSIKSGFFFRAGATSQSRFVGISHVLFEAQIPNMCSEAQQWGPYRYHTLLVTFTFSKLPLFSGLRSKLYANATPRNGYTPVMTSFLTMNGSFNTSMYLPSSPSSSITLLTQGSSCGRRYPSAQESSSPSVGHRDGSANRKGRGRPLRR